MSANDYIINISSHIQSGFKANFGLKNAKVLDISDSLYFASFNCSSM